MEAMSVEQLLLAAWEEEGFIGKTRVPVGASDLDVLAVNLNTRTVRTGESKVREGSQRVYVVDDWCVAEMGRPGIDFRWWLEEGWSKWLNTLPQAWDQTGQPVVPWLPPIQQVDRIEVVFCCNLHLFTDQRDAVHDALSRAAESSLRENPALGERLDAGLPVKGSVRSTLESACDLMRFVRRRISEQSYGRRFGDPFKDLARELHRYLNPDMVRLPKDERGEVLGPRKSAFEGKLRRHTGLAVLAALGVEPDEVRRWINEEDCPPALVGQK